MNITADDITQDDITEDIIMANPALTEAVYYILLSLIEPMHGYGIMQNVEKLSQGRVRLAAGTLYGAISSMLEKGWIQALGDSGSAAAHDRDNRGKKEYRITPAGCDVLKGEIIRLTELLENGRKILESEIEK
jgi:DNA-binding PadR family transcriptional regulator